MKFKLPWGDFCSEIKLHSAFKFLATIVGFEKNFYNHKKIIQRWRFAHKILWDFFRDRKYQLSIYCKIEVKTSKENRIFFAIKLGHFIVVTLFYCITKWESLAAKIRKQRKMKFGLIDTRVLKNKCKTNKNWVLQMFSSIMYNSAICLNIFVQ